jgi:uncharacterized RDD family membrane protein YckC
MKCPKCGYLGYERTEKCRNCGYEFSLGSAAPTPDLRLRDGGSVPSPLDDLELVDAAAHRRTASPFSELRPDPAADATPMTPNGLAELPLFGPPITDDVPLITKASPPRPPLAVRRSTPEVTRLRSEPRTPLLEWQNDAPATAVPPPLRPSAGAEARVSTARRSEPQPAGGAQPASIGARALAAIIDVALLAVVDIVVFYLTLKICGVSFDELGIVPKAPLIAFMLVQNGGYLIAFTAVGQTLGKLLAGVRVLADDSDDAPDVGRAAVRTLVWLALAVPAGLGFVSAALSRDHRGLHDRFAGTRVVRAGA